MTAPFSHRSSLKQSNKPFKSRHASKGELKGKSKGKVNKTPGKGGQGGTLSRVDRKNVAKLHLLAKNAQLGTSARLYQGLESGVPKIMAIVPLCPDVQAGAVVEALTRAITGGTADEAADEAEALASVLLPNPALGSATLRLERFKQRLQLLPLPRHLLAILDAVKVADYVCFLVSAQEEVDAFGLHVLSCIKAQGVPSLIHAVQHLEATPPKQHGEIRRALTAFLEYHFPGEPKLFALSAPAEVLTTLRHVTSHVPKNVVWREKLSYCLMDRAEYVPDDDNEAGTLRVTGYVRGNPLSPNRLVHLPDFGDFQLHSIHPHPSKRDRVSMDCAGEPLYPDPERQDSLVAENEVDGMAAEQTWPTAQELLEAEERVAGQQAAEEEAARPKRRVPKGTSAYQAAWILDDVAEEEEEQEKQDIPMTENQHWNSLGLGNGPVLGGGDNDDASSSSSSEELVDEEEEEAQRRSQTHTMGCEGDEEAEDDDDEEEGAEDEKAYATYLQRRKASQEDLDFPDEVDTPRDVPARVRFQRYRGLKSFRTSPWDPYENLPIDYARIFQFANFNRSRKMALATYAQEAGAAVGTLVTIVIKGVPCNVQAVLQAGRPLALFSLLPHEHKMSLLNLHIQRVPPTEGEPLEPIKSKDPLLMVCGYRRLVVHPVFSTNTRAGTNNVHKFERFLQPGRSSTASVYAPILFSNAPALFFKYSEDPSWSLEHAPLVATGSVADMDVKRIIAKRIILTGHPFKVNKRGAVVRFMFFNPQDIAYFKPIELTTKMGRTGHIKDSLGTHGHMKCLFDAGLKAHDTVCMYLYKRVFPKWDTRLFSALEHAPARVEGGMEGVDTEMEQQQEEDEEDRMSQ